jgi:flagellin
MVALQTLKGINKGMAKVQDEISTGLKVATAKDNAAVWSIAQTMKSDIGGLQTVSEALSLGSSTVGTARAASESISDMLTEAKKKIAAAGDLSTASTRTKLLADLTAIGEQINDIVSSAALNGINLIGTAGATAADAPTAPGAASYEVVGAITRTAAGAIGTQTITIDSQDLSGVGAVLTALVDADLLDADAIAATLTEIESEVTTVNDAAAAFGSAQTQIEIQSSFVGKFIDSLKEGMGAMVDADMEEASARLAALQTQQQLGIQSLTIANQAPQNILALFR